MKNIKENPRFVTMPQVHPAQVDCLCDVPGSSYMEIWKDIAGYNGKYQVSNYGKVKSLYAFYGNNGKTLVKRDLYLNIWDVRGYKYVTLSLHGKVKALRLHRLVLITFKGIEVGKQVNHINGIKSDNRLENLEWLTPSENQKHSFRIGLHPTPDNGWKKPVAMVKGGIIIKQYNSIAELCRAEGYPLSTIKNRLKGNKVYNEIRYIYN